MTRRLALIVLILLVASSTLVACTSAAPPGRSSMPSGAESARAVAVLPVTTDTPGGDLASSRITEDPQLLAALEEALEQRLEDHEEPDPLTAGVMQSAGRLSTSVLRLQKAKRKAATGTSPAMLVLTGYLSDVTWLRFGPLPVDGWPADRTPVRIELIGGPGSYRVRGEIALDFPGEEGPRDKAFAEAEARLASDWARTWRESEVLETSPSRLNSDPHHHRQALSEYPAFKPAVADSLLSKTTAPEAQSTSSVSPDQRYEVWLYIENAEGDREWIKDSQTGRTLGADAPLRFTDPVWDGDTLFVDIVTCDRPEENTFVHLEIDLPRMRVARAIPVGPLSFNGPTN